MKPRAHIRLHVARSLPHNGQAPLMWQTEVKRNALLPVWVSPWRESASDAIKFASEALAEAWAI